MADKGKILGVVAWSLVFILLVGVVLMAASSQKQTSRANGFRDFLVQLGNVAGVEALSVEAVAVVEEAGSEAPEEEPAEGDAAEAEEPVEEEATSMVTMDDEMIPTIVEQVEGAILGTQLELVSTKAALKQAQSDASDAQVAADSFAQEQTEKADSLAKELAARSEDLDEVKAQGKKAEKAKKKAKKAADKKAAELSAKLDDVKAEMAEETARLQGELDAALQQLAEQESMGDDRVAESLSATDMAMDEESAEAEAVMEQEEVIEAVVVEEEVGRVIGQSKMFTFIRYSAENDSLFLQLQDGQTLSYQDIPEDVIDDMLTSEAKLDLKYRFNIQGNYKSLPPDSVVIRKFWKNSRHRPQFQEVRLIEDEPLPEVIVEEAVVEEAAPEETVEAEVVVEEAAPEEAGEVVVEEAVEEVEKE